MAKKQPNKKRKTRQYGVAEHHWKGAEAIANKRCEAGCPVTWTNIIYEALTIGLGKLKRKKG